MTDADYGGGATICHKYTRVSGASASIGDCAAVG